LPAADAAISEIRPAEFAEILETHLDENTENLSNEFLSHR
jgi:hypothetical protein